VLLLQPPLSSLLLVAAAVHDHVVVAVVVVLFGDAVDYGAFDAVFVHGMLLADYAVKSEVVSVSFAPGDALLFVVVVVVAGDVLAVTAAVVSSSALDVHNPRSGS